MSEAAVKGDFSSCPLHQINAFDPAILQDPYPYFARLRSEAPVWRDPNTNIVSVSTYDRIMEVNTQPAVYSNDFGAALRSGSTASMDPDEVAIMEKGYPITNTLLTADPPVHTRFRKLVAKAFTFKRVEGMADYIASVTNDLLDGIAPLGACEFKSAFSNHLPMTVIADALGVPRSDMGIFHTWSEAFVAQLGGISNKATRLDAAQKIVDFQNYFAAKIEEKRANPTDDIISDLVQANLAEEGDSRHMDYSELLSIMQQLLVAGNETTAHSLTAGLFYLISNPDQQAKIAADPSLVPGFVEETLRMLSPTNNMWRVATRDAELAGVPIKKGDMILLRYGSGNRDDAHFPNADAFDAARANARTHLAFGAGIHTCIAAPLARKEMNVAFPIILKRLKNIRLQEGTTIAYSPNILLRGVLELHVRYEGA